MIRRNAKSDTNARKAFRIAAVSAAVISVFATSNAALAFEIPTGNDDLVLRWDNTFRYNLAQRVQAQDPAMLGAVNNDDGNRNFKRNSLVANRLDILSEIDIVWQRSFGARVSGAGWYDDAYRSLDNTSPRTENTLVNGLPTVALSDYTKRFAKGASGEFLDAFVFANFNVGATPVNVKVGQHTVYWGDSLLGNGAIHGISYGQYAIDAWKSVATPGAEAKEIFRPRNGLTLQLQPTNDLSIAAQYFFGWQAIRYPESGSYLTYSDAALHGGQSFITGLNPLAAAFPGSPVFSRLWRGTDDTPKQSGDWGISARWAPDWLDGTLGLYYRYTSDIQPNFVVTPGVAGLPAATCTAIGGQPLPGGLCIINKNVTNQINLTQQGKFGEYNVAYGTGIDIFGISLSKNFGGVSFGSELSYRQNMPLVSDGVTVLPAALANPKLGQYATTCPNVQNVPCVPTHGTPSALGNTWHGLINGVAVLPATPLFNTASLAGELTWMMWDKVTQNEAVFKGRSGYTAIDRVSKSYFGLALNFTPTWFQVYPGVDLLMPIAWSQGISGTAAVTGGGWDGGGTYAAGFALDMLQKYRVDLKYVGFYGNYTTNAATGAVDVFNGTSNAQLSDRGFVALTFKTTF